ncbi:MAG TPA: HAD hydrolase family protein [Prolixibacteraceae bacterium]|nr:HAD hydrolase family protein [Prolixibacteraceae bacterium]HPS12580.1 HAD hydrolase family protein [Prolixibacteraceae bacterium]
MAFFKEELLNVKAFVFDVDGVLSKDFSPLNEEGEPMRTANVKDGYAIRNAITEGYPIAIISGGKNENIRKRYQNLGVKFNYIGVKEKIDCFNDFLLKNNLSTDSILCMGDDLPDLELLELSGIPTCPADAVTEVKLVSKYISDRNGGEGCVRDVIEQVLRAQGKWNHSSQFKQSSY